MKRLLLLISLVSLGFTSNSQNFAENRSKADNLKSDANYYWGESDDCKSKRRADDDAMKKMIQNISDDSSLQNLFFPDSEDEDVQRERVIETFADDIKRSSDDIILNDAEGAVKVFRYISKSDFNAMCEKREKLIIDYINQGRSAEEQLICDVALRYYYWALMLCYSHPDGENLYYYDTEMDYEDQTYRWLQDKIESLLSEIVVVPHRGEGSSENEFVFGVNLYGNSVSSLAFEYNDGNGTVSASVNNGICHIQLADSDMGDVILVIDIENRDAAKNLAVEAYTIMNVLDEHIDFPSSRKVVPTSNAQKVRNIDEMKVYADDVQETMAKTESFMDSLRTSEDRYSHIMKAVEMAINSHDSELAKQYFTPDGYVMFRDMLNSGKCKIIATPSYKYLNFKDEVICRSIPMQFDFANHVSLIREVTFRIENSSMLISSLSFRLTDIAEGQILSKDRWSEDARLTLMNFLEDYQTAYALKRREYLNQIFSDNALIIIGSVFKETKKSDNINLREDMKVKYDTVSKSQFISRLIRTFDNNEFVNLRFTDTQFNLVNGINNVVGVEVKQEYTSSNYGDTGYLFLMVDLRYEKPIIHVRTWQPKETSVDDKIDANSFMFE